MKKQILCTFMAIATLLNSNAQNETREVRRQGAIKGTTVTNSKKYVRGAKPPVYTKVPTMKEYLQTDNKKSDSTKGNNLQRRKRNNTAKSTI